MILIRCLAWTEGFDKNWAELECNDPTLLKVLSSVNESWKPSH